MWDFGEPRKGLTRREKDLQALKPAPSLLVVLAAGVVTLGILAADALALMRAQRALAPGLSQEDPMLMDTVDGLVPCLDLGIGDDIHARVARSFAAYRARDRALSVVQGSPEPALAELRRAVVRGAAGFVFIGAVFGAHWVAAGPIGLDLYAETACEAGNPYACRNPIAFSNYK
ncbi:MAG: hypothetical protein HUU21_09180 [Polyangiaceae bacterium]|nr:hypothetical protein [Polyangiaceae bacterium]